MPTKYKDYPVYTYDEPAVYNDFTGGINTDPSNEHLLKNELRDAVNFTYLSGALVKRKGAKKLCDISCDEDLETIQGIFLFTYRITYIIIAADGKLYQGVFNEDAPITLSRLIIQKTSAISRFAFDETDSLIGIEEKQPSELIGIGKHDGYIQSYIVNNYTDERFLKNIRGDYQDVEYGLIAKGDIFIETDNLYEKQYLCIKEFEKEMFYPKDLINWKLVPAIGTHEPGDAVELSDGSELLAIDITDDSDVAPYFNQGIYYFKIQDIKQWQTGDIVYYNGKFYECTEPHYNRYGSLRDEELFVEISSIANSIYREEKQLIFQNYRKIEAATFNNKLYIATGTRIVEVYLQSDELKAKPVEPYLINNSELVNIGFNYMSPYPELAIASQKDTVTTSIANVKVNKTTGGRYLLQPIMNIQKGDSVKNYYFRWEKLIDGVWYCVVPFKSQKQLLPTEDDNSMELEKYDYSTLEVDDADTVQYRCTFAKSFENSTDVVEPFDITKSYAIGQFVSVGARIYKCIKSYDVSLIKYPSTTFQLSAYIGHADEEGTTITYEDTLTNIWVEVYELEMLPYIYEIVDDEGRFQKRYSYIYDFKINQVDGEYFGSAVSVLFNNDLKIEDTFLTIHSCTKILVDGSKILFYGDKYNSGMWYKTILNNPGYVTDRGCLSFKTTKNEAVVKVVPFQGNLIVFANAENSGGSIHLVKGNGDDYNAEDGYYSPYQRSTINASISSDNADSIQICDNLLIFKYFNRVYCINASDLNNDVVKVTSLNNRILTQNEEVAIPWDDNDCISVVTDTYYALMWKEKYTQDKDGELILQHPGMRVKMYYNMSVVYDDKTYGLPWLRDEGEVFNAKFVVYIKGKPLYLYNNILVTFDEEYYKDIDKDYVAKFHPRAEGLNYETQFKFIEHVIVGFHRNQFNNVDLDVIIKNEAGHVLIDTTSKRFSIGDLRALKLGQVHSPDAIRLDTTIQDNKLINSVNMFPCLLADATIIAKTSGSFTLTSITYNYTSCDAPDQNPYDLYSGIIRPREVNNK